MTPLTAWPSGSCSSSHPGIRSATRFLPQAGSAGAASSWTICEMGEEPRPWARIRRERGLAFRLRILSVGRKSKLGFAPMHSRCSASSTHSSRGERQEVRDEADPFGRDSTTLRKRNQCGSVGPAPPLAALGQRPGCNRLPARSRRKAVRVNANNPRVCTSSPHLRD
jgi:hypothetical protein